MSQRALPIVRAIKDRDLEATALKQIQLCLYRTGNPRQSIEYGRQALALRRERGQRSGEASVLVILAWAMSTLGDTAGALQASEAAALIWTTVVPRIRA